MQTYADLRERWESQRHEIDSYTLVDHKHQIDINIGYDAKLRKTLLICNTGKISNLPSSKAISAQNVMLSPTEWGLAFSLQQEDISDIFIKFCWDIIESTRDVEDDAVEFILNRYNMWLRLLTYKRPTVLSVSRQKGLIGELLYLQNMVHRFGQKKAVSSWVGPGGGDQDFVYDDTWTEVKAVSFASDTVSISSVEQLDTDKPGFLRIYRLEDTSPEDNDGINVTDVVEKTGRLLTESSPAADFRMKLFQYGYTDEQNYENFRYKLGASAVYRVDENFPRMTRESLNSSVSWIKYGLSIPAISEFKVEEND